MHIINEFGTNNTQKPIYYFLIEKIKNERNVLCG